MDVRKDKRRVIVEAVEPEIDAGRFPIKRVIGERVVVEADVFIDGLEAVSCAVRYRKAVSVDWDEKRMMALGNDRWRAEFTVTELGYYQYTVVGWLDHFQHWKSDLVKRERAGQNVSVDLQIGGQYVAAAAGRADDHDQNRLQFFLDQLRSAGSASLAHAYSNELAELMYRYTDRSAATSYERVLTVWVDRERARFSAWYEFFPRSSWSPGNARLGTFNDAVARLPYIRSLGFDIIYLPPIHPIGVTKRKGKNNNVTAQPGDVGCPWAIGGNEGGHKTIHPDLGSLDDFSRLVDATRKFDMEIALDIAFQVSPDHPWVRDHPEWFLARPDGTIQYAENPPKKYEDVYPFNFESPQWQALWQELKSVVDFWIGQGVRAFRADNPHTKSLRFWQWLIGEVHNEHADVIFLAEAFTRPKVQYYLSKVGFTQSYTYFTSRKTRDELTEYFTELTQSRLREFFRPNIWPNTPDILTKGLQEGGLPAFGSRIMLAATQAASYGIYGPAYELGVNTGVTDGENEYLNSEKYEIKQWDVSRPNDLSWLSNLITKLNRIRRHHPALQTNTGLRFIGSTNEQLLAYYKATADMSDVVLTVVNLDPQWTQSGMIDVPIDVLGIATNRAYELQDLLTGTSYFRTGRVIYIELDPQELPAHVFKLVAPQ